MTQIDEGVAVHATSYSSEWTKTESGGWQFWEPPEGITSEQGWKVHVSFLPRDYVWVTRELREVAVAHRRSFKFATDPMEAMRRVTKGFSRLGAGKQSCIYTVDAETTQAVVEELAVRLQGLDGPDILTSLRCASEPIFVRWGSFTERYMADDAGRRVHAVLAPDGSLREDQRKIRFSLPEWVPSPEFVDRSLTRRARLGTELAAAGLRVDSVLQYSTGGGVYRGRYSDKDGEVLLKEARPSVAFDESGADAIMRLRKEYGVHRTLQDVKGVPRALSLETGNRHLFMVREYVQGEPLSVLREERRRALPLASFIEWTDDVLAGVETIVTQIHDLGWGLNDINSGNVIIDPAGAVSLIDLESATLLDSEDTTGVLHTVNFTPDLTARGLERDLNSLAALTLWLVLGFVPPANSRSLGFVATLTKSMGLASVRVEAALARMLEIAVRNEALRGQATHGTQAVAIMPGTVSSEAERTEASIPVSDETTLRDWVARVATTSLVSGQSPEDADRGLWSGLLGAATAVGATTTSEETAVAVDWFMQAEAGRTRDEADALGAGLSEGNSGIVFSAGVLGRPYPVDQWVTAVVGMLAERDYDRSVLNGLGGVLLACIAWGERAGDIVEPLARAVSERILDPGQGDASLGLLNGRAGAGLTLLAATRTFGIEKEGEAMEMLTSSWDSMSAQANVSARGGLDGLWGVAAVMSLTSAGRTTAFIDRVTELAKSHAPMLHADIGLERGVGGTYIAMETLRRRLGIAYDDQQLRDEAWLLMSRVFESAEESATFGPTHQGFGLSRGSAGLLTGLTSGADFFQNLWNLD